jgi:hypothetical protein
MPAASPQGNPPARSGFFGKAAMLANGAGADLHTN